MVSTPPDPFAPDLYPHCKSEDPKARFSEVDRLTCEQVPQPLSLHEMLSQSPLSRLDFESPSISVKEIAPFDSAQDAISSL